MWRIFLALALIPAGAAYAQELTLFAGGLTQSGTKESSPAWAFEYLHPLNENIAASFSWLNEGHVPGHHRDGHSMQIWGRTNVFHRRPQQYRHERTDVRLVLRPGRYASLAAMGLNDRVSSVRSVSRNARIEDNRNAPPPVVAPRITFYERENFDGRYFAAEQQIANLERNGFNDRASSVIVDGDRWEVCEDVRFSGRCVVLRPGRYASLAAMGFNDRISSVRDVSRNARIEDNRNAPAPVALGDYNRRANERLYEAKVTSVRAVVGTPEQRSWVEQEQVPQERSKLNVPGAVVGAVIGGILGHQVGSGRGQDIATVGGAVAGGAVGANVGRDRSGQQVQTQDVQRCENVQSQARPDHWDVTYDFRGQEHRMQMSARPGPTITVNERGEPRS